MKKLALIGRGTAGAQSILHMLRWTDFSIDWYFDPNTPTKAVGEGSNLSLPRQMYKNANFGHQDLKKVDVSFKTGIYKEGWGPEGKPFFHDFFAPYTAWHFDAVKLQNYILDLTKQNPRVRHIEFKCDSHSQIDADFIFDCSGKPSDLSQYHVATQIPVNSVYVSHCNWDGAEFDYTLTIARPYGWVFGIPLQSRCAIGYLYNNKFNSLDEIKEDIQVVLDKYKLTESRCVSFSFDSYYRKKNFEGRVAYNGDKSFFLEPLEATSTYTMEQVCRNAWDYFTGSESAEKLNSKFTENIEQIYDMIMLHYYAGSPFKTNFWEMAKENGETRIRKACTNNKFQNIIRSALTAKAYNYCPDDGVEYGSWWSGSFYQNIHGFEISDKIKSSLVGNVIDIRKKQICGK